MALVLMATHGWGTLWAGPANLVADVGGQASFTNPADATAATHYADAAGASPSTGPVTADANGRLMRYIEEGTYNQTLPGGAVLEVQAVSGATVASVESKVQDVYLATHLPAGFVSDSTSVTSAIQAWGVAAQAVIDSGSGVRMVYGSEVYRYTSTLSVTPMIRLEGAPSLTIEGTGTFADQRTGYTDVGFLFRVYTCKNIRAKLRVTSEPQLSTAGDALPVGHIALEMYQGSTIDLIDVEMIGGRQAVSCVKLAADPDSYKVRGGRINIRTVGVFYPYAGEFSGCDNEVHIDAINPGRGFCIYGVENSEIHCRTKDQSVQSVISSYGGQGCSNINVHYTDRESTVGTFGVGIQYKQGPLGQLVTHRDISIHYDTKTGIGNADCRELMINKDVSEADGSADYVGRGHVLDGLKVSGSIEHVGTGVARNIINHGSDGELVSPDVIRRPDFSDLRIVSSAAGDLSVFRATCLEGTAHVRNVNSTQDFIIENQGNGQVSHIGSIAKRFCKDATDRKSYLDCEVTGSSHVFSAGQRAYGRCKGTNLDDAYTPHYLSGSAARLWLPTSCKMATHDRTQVALTDISNAIVSGTLVLSPLGILRAGDSLASVIYISGAAAAITPTNQWACLVRASDLKIKAISTDRLTTAWAANTPITFPFASYSPTQDEIIYSGVMVAAGTVPSIVALLQNNTVAALAPIRWGASNTGQTTPLALDTVVTTPGGGSKIPFAYAI